MDRNKKIIIGAIVFIFFILIIAAGGGEEPVEIDNVQTQVEAGQTEAKLQIGFDGREKQYDIKLIGPDGVEISTKYINKSDMTDHHHTVEMDMTKDLKVTPSPGTYKIQFMDYSGLVYQENVEFSGADLIVESVDTTFESQEYFGYDLNYVEIQVRNSEDLPAYITQIRSNIGNQTEKCFVQNDETIIHPGETQTVTASNYIALTFEEPGDYDATFELLEGNLSYSEVESYSKTVTIG